MKYNCGINIFDRAFIFTFIIFLLFSCSSDKKNNVVQENNISGNGNRNNIISIYAHDNTVDFWSFNVGEYQVSKSDKLSSDLFFPLGILQINSIQEDKITIELPSNEIHSKFKTKQLKTSFLDSIIPFKIPFFEKSLNLDDYTLIVLPSKPDEFGNFKGCISCPFNEQELYLKCKLEWESIFGDFKEIPVEGISDSKVF